MNNLSQIREYMRKSYICIDEYSDSVFSARLYRDESSEAEVFSEWKRLVYALDKYYDETCYPQASTTARSFKTSRSSESSAPRNAESEKKQAEPQTGGDTAAERPNGQRGTFILQVVYRQHASWQGSLCWVEKGLTKPFRSELELFRLIDLALNPAAADSE